MAERAQQWDFQNSWDRQDPAPKTRGMYEVKEDAELREEVKELKCQFATLVLNKPVNAAETCQADVCGLCASPMYFTLMYKLNVLASARVVCNMVVCKCEIEPTEVVFLKANLSLK
jgi:hypothetical protein